MDASVDPDLLNFTEEEKWTTVPDPLIHALNISTMTESFWSVERIMSDDGGESVISQKPRKNTIFEDTIAIFTLLSWFG